MSSNSYKTPPWPSLYNPGLEIHTIQHQDAVQKGGHYLYRAGDVFRFTLYWTLIFYIPLFLLCGCYAFWNYALPPSSSKLALYDRTELYPLNALNTTKKQATQSVKLTKTNEKRTRIAFAIIVLFTFITISLAGAVIGSAVLGFVAAGLYSAAKFNMSTWIPFLLSVIQVVVSLLSLWPSIIEIM